MTMIEIGCNEPWYAELEAKYGYEFCANAGYFPELKEFDGSYYECINNLPFDTNIIQFSGAFHPFHEGHLDMLKNAIDFLGEMNGTVVIHVDHKEYRESKGVCNKMMTLDGLNLLHNFFPYKGWDWFLVGEDNMPNGASRNFTRLYSELSDMNHNVYFLCGGDRANYSLTFIDKGYCIISGRDDAPMYNIMKYRNFNRRDRIKFVKGNNPTSSTNKRMGK